MNVADFLRRHAAERPHVVALRFPAGRDAKARTTWDALTFSELHERAGNFARGLAASGLRRGDRTLLLVKPSLDFYPLLFGMFQLGAVPVLLDPGMGMKNLLACIGENAPRAMIAIPPVHAVRMFVRRPFASVELPITAGRRWFWGGTTLAKVLERAQGAPPVEGRFAADDEAAIIFTSGSTGTPKGVSYRHGMFAAQVENIAAMYGLGPGTVIVECFAPFAIFDLAMGSTVVIPEMDLSKPATVDPARVVQAIVDHSATCAFASPIVWSKVVRHGQQQGSTLPSLRKVLSAGAPIPADLHRRFRDLLSEDAEVHTPYGATECLPVASIGSFEVLGETWPETARGMGTCVGRPIAAVDARIVRIDDAPMPKWKDELLVPDGEIGELCVRGPMASPEYKEKPAANALSKIPAGEGFYHRMGDLAWRDAQGRLWFCGRKSHRLNTAAGMVPADAVEGIFNEHPAVFRTALVGVGTPEVPVLCVEMEPGQAFSPELERELLDMAKGTRWEGVVVAALPHPGFPVDARHNSKIRREDLKIWASTRMGQLPGRALPAPREAA